MINLLYAFIVILIIKFLINLSRYMQCKSLLKEYENYVVHPSWTLTEKTSHIVRLFKEADIQDAAVGYSEPIGFGKVLTGTVSVFGNISTRTDDVVQRVLRMFHEAIGVYRSRMWETINPLYWIESIIFLPRQLFIYLGVPPESILIKLGQMIYWLLCIVAGVIYGIYKPDVEAVVRSWLAR
jgi:hypothetical protein